MLMTTKRGKTVRLPEGLLAEIRRWALEYERRDSEIIVRMLERQAERMRKGEVIFGGTPNRPTRIRKGAS
jgi:hypothetical protein